MDTSKLLTLGIVGIGLYVLYEYLISQGARPHRATLYGSSTCGMLLGTFALPAVTQPLSSAAGTGLPITGVNTTPLPTGVVTDPTPTAAATALTAMLQQAAGTTGNMTPDQWVLLLSGHSGKAGHSAVPQFENILTALGLTDATRGTPITAAAFTSALNENGLSGLGYYRTGWVPMGAIHGRLGMKNVQFGFSQRLPFKAYALYEWLQTQCATAGSSMYGDSICSTLLPAAIVAPAAQPPTTPVSPTPTQTAIPATQQANAGPSTPAVPPSCPTGQMWVNPSNMPGAGECWPLPNPGNSPRRTNL